MQTNTDITLYNKYLVGRVDTWQRTQIEDVHWEQRHARNQIDSDDLATIFIPFARGGDYLAPRVWQVLTPKTGSWTLQIGDVIVKGLIADELAGSFTLSDLKRLYDDVLIITSVDTRDFGSSNLQHWQVGAK